MQWEVKPVLETFRTQYDGDIVTINIGDDIIHSTGGHPFWVIDGVDLEYRPVCDCLPDCDQKTTPNGRWVYARDLQIGDVVRSRSFSEQKISALEIFVTKTLVYNFLVDDLHNYCVGKNETLVHNTNTANTKYEYEYKAKTRDKHTDNMKSGHSLDKKNMDWVAKETQMSAEYRRDFHDSILSDTEIKKRGEALPKKELLSRAKEFMNTRRETNFYDE